MGVEFDTLNVVRNFSTFFSGGNFKLLVAGFLCETFH